MISQKIDAVIREVPNFPKLGINFKDITTILLAKILTNEIYFMRANNLAKKYEIGFNLYDFFLPESESSKSWDVCPNSPKSGR